MLSYLIRLRRQHVRRMTGKTPPRRRAVPRTVWPTGVDLAYRAHLLRLLEVTRATVERRLFPRLRLLVDRHARADALADDFSAVKVSLLEGPFASRELAAAIETIGRRTSDWQKAQLQHQLRAAVGVDVPIGEPQWAQRIETFTEENVGLIRSIPEEYLAQVQRTVLRGIAEGSRWEDLVDTIGERFGVAESRAALIARDQVGKFYSSLNAARQQDLGLTHFFWRTAGDERVRPEHVALNGERFSWNKLPAEGMPGTPINCRCNADPDVEALLDEL
ncbi:MAG: minor capsid protein [Myxococcota bacterium]